MLMHLPASPVHLGRASSPASKNLSTTSLTKPAAAVGTTSFVLAILAKLEADPLSGGSPETAVAVAKEALPLLDFLRPSSDSVIAEVQAIMNDCLAELRLGGEDA